MEFNLMKFFRAILSKTKTGGISSSNIKSELGLDEIMNVIQKNRIKWFENVMTEGKISKRNTTHKNGEDTKRETHNQMDIPN